MVGGSSSPPLTDKLYVFPWQIYPDMVVFDWFIRLSDKDRSDFILAAKTNLVWFKMRISSSGD